MRARKKNKVLDVDKLLGSVARKARNIKCPVSLTKKLMDMVDKIIEEKPKTERVLKIDGHILVVPDTLKETVSIMEYEMRIFQELDKLKNPKYEGEQMVAMSKVYQAIKRAGG